MLHKNYLLRIYESYKFKNGRIMELEDFTTDKILTCGIGRTTLPFGYNICDSDFFKHYLSDVDMIDETYYRFICSQLNFVPIAEYLYMSIDEKTHRSMSMGLEQRKDLSIKEKYEYFSKNEKLSPKTVYYHCDNELGLILSELHYYVINNYKLTFCQLCGKPFFTTNLKNKFCIRKGLDHKYPEYTCKKIRELQRNNKCASDEIKRLRKSIKTTLERQDGAEYPLGNRADSFLKEDIKHKESLKPSEYEQWIKEMHKKILPKGKIAKESSNTD